jgi:hypothetical protein
VNSNFQNTAFRRKLLAAALPPAVKPLFYYYYYYPHTRLGRPKAGLNVEAKEKCVPLSEVQMQFADIQFVSRLGLYRNLLFNRSQQ